MKTNNLFLVKLILFVACLRDTFDAMMQNNFHSCPFLLNVMFFKLIARNVVWICNLVFYVRCCGNLTSKYFKIKTNSQLAATTTTTKENNKCCSIFSCSSFYIKIRNNKNRNDFYCLAEWMNDYECVRNGKRNEKQFNIQTRYENKPNNFSQSKSEESSKWEIKSFDVIMANCVYTQIPFWVRERMCHRR